MHEGATRGPFSLQRTGSGTVGKSVCNEPCQMHLVVDNKSISGFAWLGEELHEYL